MKKNSLHLWRCTRPLYFYSNCSPSAHSRQNRAAENCQETSARGGTIASSTTKGYSFKCYVLSKLQLILHDIELVKSEANRNRALPMKPF